MKVEFSHSIMLNWISINKYILYCKYKRLDSETMYNVKYNKNTSASKVICMSYPTQVKGYVEV